MSSGKTGEESDEEGGACGEDGRRPPTEEGTWSASGEEGNMMT